jgi:four helix bundle protein
MQTHKDLDVWKLSMDLVEKVYEITNHFPKEELFGLTAQIRKSAISVPSNIAEGAARKGNAEFLRFLYIALGSLTELETQLLIAIRLKYLNNDSILEQITLIGKKLVKLIDYHQNKREK